MVISHNQVANYILFGLAGATEKRDLFPTVRVTRRVEVLEGSLFEDDNKDHHVHVLLHRVRQAMEEGIVLVIIGLDVLYESLYDVFNKNYTQVYTAV